MARIEIDQSGKWEERRHTVIGACAGGRLHSSLISFNTKNTVQNVIGKFEQEKNRSKKRLIIRLFTCSVFLSVKDLVHENDILIIDEEYPGNENSIRDLLLHLFRRFKGLNMAPQSINFACVGKSSLAHKAAYETFTYSRNPDKILNFEDFFALADRTEKIRKKALADRKRRNLGK